MSYNFDELLSLSAKEKRNIAGKLWRNLAENNAVTKDDKKIIQLLDEKWEKIK